MKKIFLFVIFCFFIFRVNASEIDLAKHAKSAILVENSTGKIIYQKNENEKRSPASMTKIMTLLLLMERIDNETINLNDKVMISKNASNMGGTQIFLEEGSSVDVLTLLKGITIASANDAAVAIAEYIGGTEENFVLMMNNKAKELGCENTNFKNPHGLDEENHYTSAYDLSLIARELLKHDSVLKYTSMYEDNIDVSGENHWLVNTNKLVKFYDGIDGLKTGYTDKAGYCLTATMYKNNMRLISIVMGEESKDYRSEDTISMMEYGYSMYGSETILKKSEFKEKMYIDNSHNREVNYYLNNDVNIIVSKDIRDINYKINKKLYKVKAPIKKNTVVGKLIVNYNNKDYEYDLVVKENIEKSSYFQIVKNIFNDIISGIRINNSI